MKLADEFYIPFQWHLLYYMKFQKTVVPCLTMIWTRLRLLNIVEVQFSNRLIFCNSISLICSILAQMSYYRNNRSLYIVLNRAYGGQHWKGKQNKVPKKKKWRKQRIFQTCYIYRIEIAFSWQKMASSMFVYFIVMKLADEIYIPFQWRPLYYMKIQKSVVPCLTMIWTRLRLLKIVEVQLSNWLIFCNSISLICSILAQMSYYSTDHST